MPKGNLKPCQQCGRLFEVTKPRQRFCDDKVCKGIRDSKKKARVRRKKHASKTGAENPDGER